jgi:hypothetical protein
LPAAVFNLGLAMPALSQTTDKRIEKRRKQAVKIAAKDYERVKINMRNGRRVFGYITKVGDTTLTLMEENSSKPQEVALADIAALRMKAKDEKKNILIVGGIGRYFA